MLPTARLNSTPFAPAHLLALIESVEAFEAQTGLRPAEGLREFFVSGDVSMEWLESLRAAPNEPDPWRFGFALVHREDGLVVGTAGFVGPPDEEGTAEIAYAIVPGYQGRGLATEAAAALVEYAARSGRVRRLRAHTLPEMNASCRVLARCGFERVEEGVDPHDGPVWRWERAITPDAGMEKNDG